MWWLSKTMVARRQIVAGMVHASLQRNVQTKAAELWETAQLDLVSVVSSYFRPQAISVKIALIFRTLPIPLLMATQHLWLIPSENVAMVSNLQKTPHSKKCIWLSFQMSALFDWILIPLPSKVQQQPMSLLMVTIAWTLLLSLVHLDLAALWFVESILASMVFCIQSPSYSFTALFPFAVYMDMGQDASNTATVRFTFSGAATTR